MRIWHEQRWSGVEVQDPAADARDSIRYTCYSYSYLDFGDLLGCSHTAQIEGFLDRNQQPSRDQRSFELGSLTNDDMDMLYAENSPV